MILPPVSSGRSIKADASCTPAPTLIPKPPSLAPRGILELASRIEICIAVAQPDTYERTNERVNDSDWSEPQWFRCAATRATQRTLNSSFQLTEKSLATATFCGLLDSCVSSKYALATSASFLPAIWSSMPESGFNVNCAACTYAAMDAAGGILALTQATAMHVTRTIP